MNLSNYSQSNNPLLIAHGGYSSKYPENTLDAYMGALPFKPDVIEMDIVIDPDSSELICHHPTVPSDDQGRYSDDVIRESLRSGEVLSLHEAVEMLKDAVPYLLLDLKQTSSESYAKLEDLFPVAERENMIIGIRDLEEMKEHGLIEKGFQTLGLLKHPTQFIEYATLGGVAFRLFEDDLSSEVVEDIHLQNGLVWVTPGRKSTPTTPRSSGEITGERLRELFEEYRVDGVLVNDIEMARGVMRM